MGSDEQRVASTFFQTVDAEFNRVVLLLIHSSVKKVRIDFSFLKITSVKG